MLEARNRMSHTYDAADALRIHARLGDFLPPLAALLAALRAA
ncbi:MAG: nucleotidyltransferase substrate binding protein [Gammaproteobacteria bacterium]|nr:nucleotidyltransferase substrate binding protein [Gammaproteobacteria bacterium]MBU1415895.1 nucleotidyltransferase substrate binding protein [Gammaproteobacteria bacterium]